jgi:hypothetical protein
MVLLKGNSGFALTKKLAQNARVFESWTVNGVEMKNVKVQHVEKVSETMNIYT